MANIKFTQLPDQGVPTDATIVPTVASGTNYTITGANLKTYVNSTTGNITAGYFIGNGSALTGLPATYGNSNVDAHLAAFGANTISTSGNVTAGYFAGNGSLLTNLPAGNYSNANVAAFMAAFGANVVSTTGNVTAGYLVGNIRNTTGGYGNSNVQTLLQSYTGSFSASTISASGNITGQNFIGNGSALTGITSTLGGTMASNISGANTYSINNLVNLSASGNITGTHVGNGANLTGIPTSIVAGPGISVSASTGAVTITNNNPTPYTNANVAAYLPTYSGNLNPGNLTVLGQTSLVGQLLSTNNITTSATITGGNVGGNHFGNGAGLSNVVTSIVAGTGISINSSTGVVTITNSNFGSYVNTTTNQTVAGNKTFTGTTTIGPYVEQTTTGLTINSGSFTPNYTTGQIQQITISSNFTLNLPTGLVTGQSLNLILIQDASGNRVMTPAVGYKFAYSNKTLSTAANAIDMMSIFYDGTNYLCNLVKGYA